MPPLSFENVDSLYIFVCFLRYHSTLRFHITQGFSSLCVAVIFIFFGKIGIYATWPFVKSEMLVHDDTADFNRYAYLFLSVSHLAFNLQHPIQ